MSRKATTSKAVCSIALIGALLFVLHYQLRPLLWRVSEDVPMVLILAYLRGGSTFTGSLFDFNPSAFYVFEPLYHIYDRALKHPNFMAQVDKSVNGPAPVAENATLFAKQVLHSYFTCEVSKIPPINFYDVFLAEGAKTKTFLKCGKYVNSCVNDFADNCLSSKLRVIKTIRLNMSDAVELSSRLPSLKIVHLIRDPRGVIASRLKGIGEYRKTRDALLDATKLCETMEENINIGEKFSKQFPGRIFTVRYEDLAERPEVLSYKLYSLLNIRRPGEIEFWLKNITRASEDSPRFLSAQRMNSSVTAYRWRKQIPGIYTSFIDKTCNNLYQKVGYLPSVNASVLRNMGIPLRTRWTYPYNLSKP